LQRIESGAFTSPNIEICLASTILFVANDATPTAGQIALADNDSCPEFGQWRSLKHLGIALDFRRILRSPSTLLSSRILDLTAFEGGALISQSNQTSTHICRRDHALIVVKSVHLSDWIQEWQIEMEMENLLSLRHPLISIPIGFVLSSESCGCRELQIGRLYANGNSLSQVLWTNPEWWTPTAKAKVIAGIALALRFAHSFGLLHGALKTSNVFFDNDRRIQIVDFSPMRLETAHVNGFSGERWTPSVDVSAFVSILSEIVSGHSRSPIPNFVSEIIKDGVSGEPNSRRSFIDILRILKENRFKILPGVDSEEVSEFVDLVESSEKSGQL
jgi:tRNA A-37 threonylcarbamoyl transferase component Bud32